MGHGMAHGMAHGIAHGMKMAHTMSHGAGYGTGRRLQAVGHARIMGHAVIVAIGYRPIGYGPWPQVQGHGYRPMGYRP